MTLHAFAGRGKVTGGLRVELLLVEDRQGVFEEHLVDAPQPRVHTPHQDSLESYMLGLLMSGEKT
jgi:hypothetical protein